MNRRWLIVAAVWLLGPVWLSAQVSTGTITGVVTDASGASVPNAQVVVTDTGKNVSRTLTTDSAGIYSAPNLETGQYSVQVSMTSFETQTKTGIDLSIGQTVTLDFTLGLGTAKESVTVVSTAQQLVDTTTSMMATDITSTQLENLPLNGRNFMDLVPLVPGAQPGAQGGTTSGQFSINGGRLNANGIQVNGADITPPAAQGLVISPNLEGIGEFQILTNNFSAQYGRSMSGIVDVRIKSGTNKVHGTVFEFIRNKDLDASQLGSSGKQLPYIFNQFGGSAGAPIIKNKFFVFGDYQGSRALQSATSFQNVPLPAMDQPSGGFVGGVPQGTYDYSATCAANNPTVASTGFVGGYCTNLGTGAFLPKGQIFNPFVSPRVAFPNNQIPASLVDPTVAYMYSFLPKPLSVADPPYCNTPGLGNLPSPGAGLPSPCEFNDVQTVETKVAGDQGELQTDYVLSPKDHLSYGMIYSNSSNVCGSPLGNVLNGNTGACIIQIRSRFYSVNYTRVISSTVVNELTYTYVETHFDAGPQPGYLYEPAIAGLGGLNTSPNSPLTTGFPILETIGAFGNTFIGGPEGGPSKQHANNPQVADNYSFIRGRHSFKTGFLVRWREFNLQQPLIPRGLYATNALTSASGAPGNVVNGSTLGTATGGYPFASTLLGVPLVAERAAPFYGAFGERDHEYGAYFQDDFKVTNRLTLNLGLRWDLYEPPREENNHIDNFSPASLTFIFPESVTPGDGVSASTLKTNWDNFGPHLGFAYALTKDGKTSLRAGYGIAYLAEISQAVGTVSLRLSENSPYSITIGGQALTQDELGIPVQTVSQGIPLVQPANPAIPPAGSSVIYIPPSQPTPYTQQWNVDLQRELWGNLLLDVAYVGTAGVHLTGSTNLNQGAPGGGAPPIAPTSKIGQVQTLLDVEQSNYNALQVKVEHRFSNDLSFLASYTYSRAIDDGSTTTGGDAANGSNSVPQNAFNFAADRGPSDNNATHRFVFSYVYGLPFGKGKKFLNGANRLEDGVLGGWQINGIVVAQTGLVFTPVVSASQSAAGPGGPVRPNIVGNPNVPGPVAANPTCAAPTTIHNRNAWYNRCAYMVAVNTFGDAGRNSLIGPGYQNFDFSLFKNFSITERWKLQVRSEVFNIFNHTNLGIPNIDTDLAAGGQITTTINQSQSSGQTSRLIQFGVKIIF